MTATIFFFWLESSMFNPPVQTNRVNLKPVWFNACDDQRWFFPSKIWFWRVGLSKLDSKKLNRSPPTKIIILCCIKHSLVRSRQISFRSGEISIDSANSCRDLIRFKGILIRFDKFWPYLLLSDYNQNWPSLDMYSANMIWLPH